MKSALAGMAIVGVLAALYVTSQVNYPLFHTLAELASIIVGCAVFMVFWNTRRFLENGYLLFLAVLWLFVAVLDLVHTLAYKDVHIIGDETTNPATQMWIATRYVEAASMLAGLYFLRRKPRVDWLLAGYGALAAAIVASVFVWPVFPACFVEGAGLTTFKIASEYVICGLFLAAAAVLWRSRERFDERVLRLLVAAIVVKIASELAFTVYLSAFGLSNFVGHIFKAAATILVYKAIIEASLRKPYSVLFRELGESQAALRRSASHLQQKVIELEAIQRQLSDAKAAAEDANMAKSQFLANMSHELRTPMSAILGMTQLALDERLTPAVREYLQTVKESADALLELLNEILDLSRVEAGGLQLESVNFDLRNLVERTLDIFSARAAEKRIEIVRHIARDVPDALVGDPLRLRQIVTNLVGNALKFTNRGRVSVRVGLVAANADAVCLEVAVLDTGIGIAPDHCEQIFAPFTQADASTTRQFGGTGLGLAICRRLVELMDGRIEVESELGAGSTFRFTAWLMRGVEPAPAAARPASRPQLHAPPAAALASQPLKVLLAEDTTANRRLVTRILEKRGHQVEAVVNGQEAIERVLETSFDLVLMDVQMPGLDGFEATAMIRKLPDQRKARVPIIAMTAHALKGDRERCLEAGMDNYIAKPIEAAALTSLVEQLGAAE